MLTPQESMIDSIPSTAILCSGGPALVSAENPSFTHPLTLGKRCGGMLEATAAGVAAERLAVTRLGTGLRENRELEGKCG